MYMSGMKKQSAKNEKKKTQKNQVKWSDEEIG